MLQALFKHPFVSIPIYPCMHSITISLPEFPLPNIRISFGSSPHPRPMLHPIYPLALIILSIWPRISSYSFRFPIDELPLVYTLIPKLLVPFTMFKITHPISFIESTISIYHYPYPMLFPIYYLSIIY